MDYPYIRVWHRMTGSYQYYIDDMVELARRDNAPQNAIYRNRDTQRWVTVDDVRDVSLREVLRKAVKQMQEG